jgi:group I intron endonuclease
MKGIYKIVNKKNGKYYVGSSMYIHNRWKKHIKMLKANDHHSPKLQRAWNKYGEDSFEFVVVEEVPNATSKSLKPIEDRYLLECKAHPETNYNASYSATTTYHPPLSDDKKRLISEKLSAVPRTEEWRRKIGEANRRRGRLSDASYEKMAEKLRVSMKGRINSEETRRRISLATKGKKHVLSDEGRAAIQAGNEKRRGRPGHKQSPLARQRMSEAKQKRKAFRTFLQLLNGRCNTQSVHPTTSTTNSSSTT